MFEQGALLSLIRLTGALAWLGVVAAATWVVHFTPQRFGGTDAPLWWASVLGFLLLYGLVTRPGESWPPRRVRLVLCGVQAALALGANVLINGHGFHSGLLVIVAGQVIFLLPLPAALLWAAAQAAAYALTLNLFWPARDAFAYTAWALFSQVYVVLSMGAAVREARARSELVRVNAELRATRVLLEQQSRVAERLRISRELHDVLGHHLTALNMNLEVAAYDLRAERAPQHIGRAREMARGLLGDVRGVVSTMRAADTADVYCGLRALAADFPHLNIHLNIGPDLQVPDVGRAQVVLRCAGEIVTNAVRHAHAQNLWLDVLSTPQGLEVRARDDGRGTSRIRLGSGLRGMRERLEEIGGSLTLASEPGRGFHVRARMPLEEVT